MKARETELAATFPDDAELAVLRSWYAGLDARAATAKGTITCSWCLRRLTG